MKTALSGIPALPDGVIAELYTITLADNTQLYYTTADTDLIYRGDLYLSGKLIIDRDVIRQSVGLEVDDVSVTLYPAAGFTINGTTLTKFVQNGGFDKANITIERARADYCCHLFAGLITDAQSDRINARLTISALTILLNVQMPKNLYSPACINNLFDTACGVNKEAQGINGTVAAGSGILTIKSGINKPDYFFNYGSIRFTSGENNGVIRSIKEFKQASGTFELSYHLPAQPEVGDTFIAYPGCDKLQATCVDKFNNAANYRGYPFIPIPEASI